MRSFCKMMPVYLILLTNACTKTNPPNEYITSDTSVVKIEIHSALIKADTSIRVCASILNMSDSALSIFPPEFGAYLSMSQYGVIRSSDTIWFNVATDIDYDTYPEIRIPKDGKYTFLMWPGYFELWKDDVSANSDKRLADILNSADRVGVRYRTNIFDSIHDSTDQYEVISMKKYQNFKLQSKFMQTNKRKSACDTGVSMTRSISKA